MMNQLKSIGGDILQEMLLPSEPQDWYYDKDQIRDSPSLRDGISTELEIRYRREGSRFIINLGNKMGMQHVTVATGVVFFHRFYMFHSFKEFPSHVTACCCFFLAGKVEETPKKCRDVIIAARTLLTDEQFAEFGEDPKNEVMTLERILLKTVRFDFNVEHPYPHLLKYVKCLKGDRSKLQKMVQMAWTFINDSFCTTLCLEWEPEVIAVAVIYLAGKLCKFNAKDSVDKSAKHKYWWDKYIEGLTVACLEDICHQILDLYPPPVASKPQGLPPASPSIKSTQKHDQVSSSLKTPPYVEAPVGKHTPKLEPEDLKIRTPKSAIQNDSDESLEVAAVLSSERNSPNEAMMCSDNDSNRSASVFVMCSPAISSAPCDSEKLSGRKRHTSSPMIGSQLRICSSTQETAHENGSGDPGKMSGSSDATERISSFKKIDMGSFIETIEPTPRLESSSKAHMSRNVSNASEAASLNPVSTTAVTTLGVKYPYFTTMLQPPQPPPQLRMGLTAPPLPPPNMLIPPPQLTSPMKFPDVLAPLHSFPPPLPQYQPSSFPPPQSVAASVPQLPPPPPLHVRGPGPVLNQASQSSSNITRLPPPLVRAPVPTAVSPPATSQASKTAGPRLLSNSENSPRPSQSAPRPSFQSGFRPSQQTTQYPVRPNSPHSTFQNVHHGAPNMSHSESQHDLLQQNLPPPIKTVTGTSAHCGSQGDSNPVPPLHEARSVSPENVPSIQERHNMKHCMDPGSKRPLTYLREREIPRESRRVRARNPNDSNLYPHFHQETDSPSAYARIPHERRYSRYGQRRRGSDRYTGHSYEGNTSAHLHPNQHAGHIYQSSIPTHLRFTSYPSPSGQYHFQSGLHHHQQPSSAKPVFPNEMIRGTSHRSHGPRTMAQPSDYDEYTEF